MGEPSRYLRRAGEGIGTIEIGAEKRHYGTAYRSA